ncbi:hypothetical protein AQJ43_29845 [Streptomyces avermitilis]|uniref:Uncharacterized protein n=1 Tax=Streptomyces avermitilis TaxID=33903 RepID=A0A4D4N854_STRAX|nr:hypothetical protein AQJ43_29845 [Streptomyces avermitilis]GDY80016.1 hypothetical protein SAV31267_095010 [Streptomyces avermitilis]
MSGLLPAVPDTSRFRLPSTFFTPGRRDAADGLAVRAGRDAAVGAAVLAGWDWVPFSVVTAASDAGPVDTVRASTGAATSVNASGTTVS